MRRTKFFVCFLAAFSALSISAMADTDVVTNKNNVTVTTDGYADKWGTLIVVKSGSSLDNSNIIAMKQALGDKDGKMVFNFALSDALGETVNGKYDLYIKNDSEPIRIENMYYAREIDRKEILDSIKSASDAKELIAVLENEEYSDILKALGFAADEYDAIKQLDGADTAHREAIADIFIEYKSMLKDDEIIDALNLAMNMESINICAGDCSEYIKNLGFAFEGTAYEKIDSNDKKQFINQYILSNRPYKTVDGIKKAYESANILYLINNTRFDVLENVFEKYAADIGISGTKEYQSYQSSGNKSKINESIVSSLKSKPVYAAADLLKVIGTAVNNTGTGSSGSSGSGGNGGSTGGGKSNSGSSDGSFTTLPVVSQKHVFDDLADASWAQTAINALAEKGIVVGDESGKFNPNDPVKREEFVKMLVTAAGAYIEGAECNFEDVDSQAWYYRYVASAFKNNIVYGVSETRFGINTQITRQDMAVMCYRAASKIKEIPQERDAITFADNDSISEYAQEAVVALYKANVVNGMDENEFVPLGTATRAQAAVMIYNLLVR